MSCKNNLQAKEIAIRTNVTPLCGSHLWTDRIVDPLDIREIVATGNCMAEHNPEVYRFNPGAIKI